MQEQWGIRSHMKLESETARKVWQFWYVW
jgi:hypothetical protein